MPTKRAAKETPPPRIATELVRWEYVERHRRKGYLTRDFFVNGHRYKWMSSGVSRDGLVRYGLLMQDEGA